VKLLPGRVSHGIELLCFRYEPEEQFPVIVIYFAFHGEPVPEPPEKAYENEAGQPEYNILPRVSQIEVVNAQQEPENVSQIQLFFLMRVGVKHIAFLLHGESVNHRNHIGCHKKTPFQDIRNAAYFVHYTTVIGLKENEIYLIR
jgi:hypothetical protein